jgi:hypothetical protein
MHAYYVVSQKPYDFDRKNTNLLRNFLRHHESVHPMTLLGNE